jgi:uncharacterized protein (DUF305 family)
VTAGPRPRPVRCATTRGGPVVPILAVLAGLLLAGCATEAPAPVPAPAPASAGFNQNDVMFLQMMVPHLEQGLTIARLAKDRAGRNDVRVLAAAIESTQADEVTTMSARLREWHQPSTAPVDAHSEHGGMPQTVDAELATLRKTTGPDFDRRFLNVMIAHQDDAIQLARVETATGSDPSAKALADQIDRSRSAQIHQMLDFLGQG